MANVMLEILDGFFFGMSPDVPGLDQAVIFVVVILVSHH